MIKRNLSEINQKLGKKFLRYKKVDFVIAGFQKAATTTLYYFLQKHPLLKSSKIKEICFFDSPINYQKGEDWYHDHFKVSLFEMLKGAKIFEATASYIMMPNTSERLYQYNPNLKIILLVRDPVYRAYSAWNMWKIIWQRSDKHEFIERWSVWDEKTNSDLKNFLLQNRFPSLMEILEKEKKFIKHNVYYSFPGIIMIGIYYNYVREYLKYYPLSQIKIINSAKLKTEKIKTLKEIEDFLGINFHDWSSEWLEDSHKREYESKLDKKTEKTLYDFYQPYNEQFFELIKKKFDWNNN